MTAKSVEAHIGRCLAESETTTQSTSILSKPSFPSPKPIKRPERLPVVNFSLIKDQALKKKLIDLGISAAGGREIMRKRLTEYTTIWNANCDAKNPRGTAQLKRDLEAWERTLGSRAPQPSALSAHIKDKDFDGLAWGSEYRDNFNDLIAQARRKIKSKPPKKSEENAPASVTLPAVPSQSLQDPASNGDDMKTQKDGKVDVQKTGVVTENPSILPLQTPPRTSEANPPSQRRFFTENADPSPDRSMTASSSSQYGKVSPILHVQETQDGMAIIDLSTGRPWKP